MFILNYIFLFLLSRRRGISALHKPLTPAGLRKYVTLPASEIQEYLTAAERGVVRGVTKENILQSVAQTANVEVWHWTDIL